MSDFLNSLRDKRRPSAPPSLGKFQQLSLGQLTQNKPPISGAVQVFCRFRPLNKREVSLGANLQQSIVRFLDETSLEIPGVTAEGREGQIKYTYDKVFSQDATQKEVFDQAAAEIVASVMDGFNGTVLAYGQTSSGKTHTMTGPDIYNKVDRGIIPRMVQYVFDRIEKSPEEIEFTVKVSMIEIYMEKVQDLLDRSKTNLKIAEDKVRGIYIQDVTETYVTEEAEVYNCMRIGNENRSIAYTNMNAQSSRSHSVFIITIHAENTINQGKKTGKLYLVDLAGSEKINKTGAAGQTLEEAKTINKSLTTLGLVINKLTDGDSQHVPYRDSKLTRVLQESLGGNSRTALIINCSPAKDNEDETKSTLQFGQRAKKIKNKPTVNREQSIGELKEDNNSLLKENAMLRLRIAQLEERVVELELQNSSRPVIQSKPEESSSSSRSSSSDSMDSIKAYGEEIKQTAQTVISAQDESLLETDYNSLLSTFEQNKLLEIKDELVPQQQVIKTESQGSQTLKVKVSQVATLTDRSETSEDDYLSDFSLDSSKNVKVFTKLGSEQSSDEMHEQYSKQSKQKKIRLLLASLKGKLFKIEELNVQIQYIKQTYGEQFRTSHLLRQELFQKDGQISYLNECLETVTEQLKGVSTNYEQNFSQLESSQIQTLKKIHDLESNSLKQLKTIQQLQEELIKAQKATQLLSQDKSDLEKQLVEVEVVCQEQLIYTQNEARNAQALLEDAIQKQTEEKQLVLKIIESKDRQNATISEQNKKLTVEVELLHQQKHLQELKIEQLTSLDLSKAEIVQKINKNEADLKQLQMMYKQKLSENSAQIREIQSLKESLEKRKFEMRYTEKQLELEIQQHDQTKKEKEAYMQILNQKQGEQVKKPIQFEPHFGAAGTTAVRRSIRGGSRVIQGRKSTILDRQMLISGLGGIEEADEESRETNVAD